jgi:hypothetical protein
MESANTGDRVSWLQQQRADAVGFLRDHPDIALARLRCTRCPVDNEPLMAPWPQPEGDAPPVFGCEHGGHGWWSTDGHQVGWYAGISSAEMQVRLLWGQAQPVPGFPVAPRPLAVGDVLDDGTNLPGYCAGAFGARDPQPKRVEAIGRDWVVARGMDNLVAYTANVAPERLVRFRRRDGGLMAARSNPPTEEEKTL